jgi:nucleotide-binding universal stress UspA family protein
MKKILAAVDGSIPSIHAAKKALELARALGAQLTLIYVSSPVMMPADVNFAMSAQLPQNDLVQGAALLDDVAATLEGAEVKKLNLFGAPANVIADTAIDEGFDLVVVGNKGRGAVTRVLVGSVTDRLVHICKRPVMVVR